MSEKFTIGSLTINIYCKESHSLKDKRRIIKSVISRLKNNYNVAVAEVNHLDNWQLATLGIVTLDRNEFMVHNTIENIVKVCVNNPNLEVLNYSKEVL